jgi:hypothetical protein
MGEGHKLSGGCLCGSVRFTATLAKPEMDVCHCSMCRRWSGGTLMTVPCTQVAIADETNLAVYTSSEWGERVFCRNCGASLFWRQRSGQGHVAVAFPSLDNPADLVFAEEIFIDEKPDLYAFAGERRRKTGEQVIAEFHAAQEGRT